MRLSNVVVGGGFGAAFGEKLSNEVETGQVGSNPIAQLGPGEKDQARRRFEQHDQGAFGEPGAVSNLGRDDNPAPVTHRDAVSPTHNLVLPHRVSKWEETG